MWQYHNPVKIIFTDKFITELTKIIDPEKKILFICSRRFTKTTEYKQIENNLADFELFTNIENNPSFVSCNLAIEFAKSLNPQTILAIGGGSVIDTAKAVRLSLMTSSSSVEEMLENDLSYSHNIEFIALPTTHGTASELTKWATIWNKEEKKKYSLSDNNNYPDYAIYDHHFVESLPLDVSLIATLDAFSHSFEALWNKNANPISDEFAIKAIKLILENIEQLSEQTTKETRINLLKATMFSGLAFSNTKTAAAHSISYPLTALYGIPHGIACSMTLLIIFKLNYPFIKEKIDKLMNQTSFDNIDDMWSFIKDFVSKKIKFSLSEYGITEKDLDHIVSQSYNKDRMGNNIAKLESVDIKNILSEVLYL